MNYYNNVFASTYKFYSKFKYEAPRGSAISVLAVSQFTSIIFLIALLKRLGLSTFTFIYPYRYFTIPVFFIWIYLIHKSYSDEKIKTILIHFNEKSITKRRLWAVIAFLSFILPSLLIFTILIL
jgi:hypothetical protein